MKKLAAISMSALLVALASGCGANTSAGGSTAKSPNGSDTKSAAPVKVRFATWEYQGSKSSIDAFIKGCKDKFNIDIELENIPSDQYANLIKTKVGAGDAADLINIHGINPGSEGYDLMKAGALADISDLKSVSDYSQAAKDYFTDSGKLYAVSRTQNAVGVLYNKKVFKDLGITQLPTNYDEFLKMADKIKAGGVTPIADGLKDLWTTQMIQMLSQVQFIESKDPSAYKTLAEQASFSKSPEFRKGLEITNDFAKRGYYPDKFLGQDFLAAAAAVANGKAAMMINGTWSYANMKDANPQADIGWFSLPLNSAGEKITTNAQMGVGVALNAKSKVMDAAKKALDYLYSTEITGQYVKDTNGVPTSSQIKSDSPFVNEVVNSIKSASYVSTGDAVKTGSAYIYKGYQNDLFNGIQAMLSGAQTIDQVMQTFDKGQADENAKNKK